MDHGYKSGYWSLWYRGSVITDTEVLFFFWQQTLVIRRNGTRGQSSGHHGRGSIRPEVIIIEWICVGSWESGDGTRQLCSYWLKTSPGWTPITVTRAGSWITEDLWPLVWNKWPPFAPKADLIEYAEEYLSVLFAESTINITVV